MKVRELIERLEAWDVNQEMRVWVYYPADEYGGGGYDLMQSDWIRVTRDRVEIG